MCKACKMDVDVTKSPDHTECIRCGMCFRTYHRFGSISLFPVINALLAKPLFHYSLLFLTSKNPAAVREEWKVKSEEVKSKNPFRKNANGIFGGEWGIRTLVGVSPNGFQDRLVMTTSITLHIKKVPKWVLFGAEGGIWTLARFLHAYSLSRGAPSASWVLLHIAAKV